MVVVIVPKISMRKKVVYIGMCADLIHHGHINIIKRAKRRGGKVIVGLLTDKAIASYKEKPLLNYKQRKEIVKNIKGVDRVIAQRTLDYTPNIRRVKPDFVIHGDDWKTGPQKEVREKIIELMKVRKGKLIEIKYTKGISSTKLKQYYGNTR